MSLRRCQMLVERALIDLRLAGDAARAAGVSTARLERVRRALRDELCNLKRCRNAELVQARERKTTNVGRTNA